MNSSRINSDCITLPAEFVQSTLGYLKQLVSDCVDEGKTVQFNGSDVERADCAAVQFLIASQRYRLTIKADGGALPLLVSVSNVLSNSIADVGASILLDAVKDSDVNAQIGCQESSV